MLRKVWIPIQDWFSGLKLRTKLFLSIMGIVCVSILAVSYILVSMGRCIMDQTIETQKQKLRLIVNSIDTKADTIYETMSVIKNSDDISAYFSTDRIGLMGQDYESLRQNASRSLFYAILQSSNTVNSCCIIKSENEYIMQNPYGYNISSAFVEKALSAVASNVKTRFIVVENNNKRYYCLYSPVYQRKTRNTYHLLLLVNDRFATNISPQYLNSEDTFLLTDIAGNILYNTSYYSPKELKFQPEKSVYSRIDAYQGRASLLLSSRLNELPWCVCLETPNSVVYRKLIQTLIPTLLLILIAFVTVSVLVWAFLRQFTNRVQILIDTMTSIEAGDLERRCPVWKRDEIGHIGASLNSMVDTINHLNSDIMMARLHAKEAQLSAIQRQINPHFLYNTLETIRMTALYNHDTAAAHMSKSLAEIFRYTIGKEKDVVTIGMEVDHTLKYIDIQKMRFRDKFSLQVDIDPLILDCRILRLALQPIVENAITHGIEPAENRCDLLLTGRLHGKTVVFSIEDTGVGIPENQLAALQTELQQPMNPQCPHERIGLFNVNERFRLYFDVSCPITIKSAENVGTTVYLSFPAVRTDET